MENAGVTLTRADQCMYGLATWSDDGLEVPAQKATGFLTSSWAIADELSTQCDHLHEHQRLISGDRTRAAQVYRYPNELCDAIVRGLSSTRRSVDDVVRTHNHGR